MTTWWFARTRRYTKPTEPGSLACLLDASRLRCANRNPGLIDEATTALEKALRMEGMLD